jgi:hypothetical protein
MYLPYNLICYGIMVDHYHDVSLFLWYESPNQKESRKGNGSSALALAETIIQNSPSILFRRIAADDPKQRKMVYVSPNISRFGYRAEDFLNDTIMFRDIVYQGDSEAEH